ncbi:MAG: hypothetical protein JNM17_26540 [Archangium sp.]|nr:hypothetical protein [Archangium sp.]
MKYRLERGTERVEVVRHGRVVTVEFGDGRTEDHGAFDDDAAEEQLQVRVDQFLSDGWEESADLKAEREKRRAAAEHRARLKTKNEALAAAADPRTALRQAGGRWFSDADAQDVAAFLALVELIEDADESGFVVRLTNGGAVRWVCGDGEDQPLDSLWLYRDAKAFESNDHVVFFGVDAGPPETPDEVNGDVDWFVQTFAPNEKYWFTREQAPWAAHSWEHDGGLKEDGRSPEQVLLSVIMNALPSPSGRGSG